MGSWFSWLVHGSPLWLFGLQVLLFPRQTSSSGFGDEPDLASPIFHFPMLTGVVEFDVASAVDFKLPQFV
jgi:hypothetical protein